MRILFVAMHNSVHTAGWLNQFVGSEHEVLLFAPYIASPNPHFESLRRVFTGGKRLHGAGTTNLVSLLPNERGAAAAEYVLERVGRRAWRTAWLCQVIRRFRPALVQSLEFQTAGYLCLAAHERMQREFPPWAVTNWGSDIYHFGRYPEHVDRIKQLLAHADYYSAECARDLALAAAFGFEGEQLPVFPNAGGFDLEAMRAYRGTAPISARRCIAVKGYQHFAGRALIALDAIGRVATLLEGYMVRIYSAAPEVEAMAERLRSTHDLDISCLPADAGREEILRLHGRSRVSIGISVSDGISTSFLEAIAMGSFPIQSATACVDEWIRDGEGGFIVSPHNPAQIAECIGRAVTDDHLVDRAAAVNQAMLDRRLARDVVRAGVLEMYRQISRELS